MQAEEGVVLYETQEGIATLTLNRPDRLNAWTPQMERAYFDLLERADDDPDIRVIVVTGKGRGFCAGMDSGVLGARIAGEPRDHDPDRPMAYPIRIRKLTIAAINGGCAGIGFMQALCCDIRFAAEDAKITSAFVRRGLAPEFGVNWLLSRAIGAARAADLLLSGRTVTGVEAAAMGLVNRAVPAADLLPTAYRYAQDVVANCPPRAIAYAKADMLKDWSRTFDQAQIDALGVYERPGHPEDFSEGVRSFVERRAPAFDALPPRPAV